VSSYGRFLLENHETLSLLREYGKAIQTTQLLMAQEGVTRACGICDQGTSRGGCCFPGVEDWYDPVLLAINLLLGRELPDRCEIPDICFFAGPHGCRLLARHSFCISYFCPALKVQLKGEPQNRLDAATGRELLLGWQLERTIRRRLPSPSPPP
jgi:hypothetical protein